MFTAIMSAALAQLSAPVLTLTREPSLRQEAVKVEVGMLGKNAKSEFWFRRTEVRNGKRVIHWTDSLSCPAARSTLEAVRSLELPHIRIAGLDNDQIVITGDGVRYSLSGSADYPGTSAEQFEIQSNVGTPIAAWIEETLQALEPCWKLATPKGA